MSSIGSIDKTINAQNIRFDTIDNRIIGLDYIKESSKIIATAEYFEVNQLILKNDLTTNTSLQVNDDLRVIGNVEVGGTLSIAGDAHFDTSILRFGGDKDFGFIREDFSNGGITNGLVYNPFYNIFAFVETNADDPNYDNDAHFLGIEFDSIQKSMPSYNRVDILFKDAYGLVGNFEEVSTKNINVDTIHISSELIFGENITQQVEHFTIEKSLTINGSDQTHTIMGSLLTMNTNVNVFGNITIDGDLSISQSLHVENIGISSELSGPGLHLTSTMAQFSGSIQAEQNVTIHHTLSVGTNIISSEIYSQYAQIGGNILSTDSTFYHVSMDQLISQEINGSNLQTENATLNKNITIGSTDTIDIYSYHNYNHSSFYGNVFMNQASIELLNTSQIEASDIITQHIRTGSLLTLNGQPYRLDDLGASVDQLSKFMYTDSSYTHIHLSSDINTVSRVGIGLIATDSVQLHVQGSIRSETSIQSSTLVCTTDEQDRIQIYISNMEDISSDTNITTLEQFGPQHIGITEDKLNIFTPSNDNGENYFIQRRYDGEDYDRKIGIGSFLSIPTSQLEVRGSSFGVNDSDIQINQVSGTLSHINVDTSAITLRNDISSNIRTILFSSIVSSEYVLQGDTIETIVIIRDDGMKRPSILDQDGYSVRFIIQPPTNINVSHHKLVRYLDTLNTGYPCRIDPREFKPELFSETEQKINTQFESPYIQSISTPQHRADILLHSGDTILLTWNPSSILTAELGYWSVSGQYSLTIGLQETRLLNFIERQEETKIAIIGGGGNGGLLQSNGDPGISGTYVEMTIPKGNIHIGEYKAYVGKGGNQSGHIQGSLFSGGNGNQYTVGNTSVAVSQGGQGTAIYRYRAGNQLTDSGLFYLHPQLPIYYVRVYNSTINRYQLVSYEDLNTDTKVISPSIEFTFGGDSVFVGDLLAISAGGPGGKQTSITDTEYIGNNAIGLQLVRPDSTDLEYGSILTGYQNLVAISTENNVYIAEFPSGNQQLTLVYERFILEENQTTLTIGSGDGGVSVGDASPGINFADGGMGGNSGNNGGGGSGGFGGGSGGQNARGGKGSSFVSDDTQIQIIESNGRINDIQDDIRVGGQLNKAHLFGQGGQATNTNDYNEAQNGYIFIETRYSIGEISSNVDGYQMNLFDMDLYNTLSRTKTDKALYSYLESNQFNIKNSFLVNSMTENTRVGINTVEPQFSLDIIGDIATNGQHQTFIPADRKILRRITDANTLQCHQYVNTLSLKEAEYTYQYRTDNQQTNQRFMTLLGDDPIIENQTGFIIKEAQQLVNGTLDTLKYVSPTEIHYRMIGAIQHLSTLVSDLDTKVDNIMNGTDFTPKDKEQILSELEVVKQQNIFLKNELNRLKRLI